MSNFLYPPLSGGGGAGGGTLRATAALAAGANNNLNPGGTWPNGYGRLILTAPSGAANITGLLAGFDGQYLSITNNDPSNNITLNNQNAGSTAANRFEFVNDLLMAPSDSVIVVYDATIARWLIT